MIRKTLLVISLVLLVGTVGLWVWSYYDQVWSRIDYKTVSVGLGVDWGMFAVQVTPWGSGPSESWLKLHRRMIGIQIKQARRGGTIVGFKCSLAAVALLIGCYPLLVLGRPALRRIYRRRHNLCVKCGYDLTGNVSGRCSECGTALAVDRSRPA